MGVESPVAAAQWAGAIGTAAAISMAIAQPIWGSLSDKWGRKPMVVRSMVAASVTLLLMGLATSPEQLLLLRLIQGGVTGTVTASNALVATSTPSRRLGFALGLVQVAVFSGMSIGPLIGGAVADAFDYRMPFYLASVLTLAGGIVVAVMVHERFTRPVSSASSKSIWSETQSLLSISIFPVLISVIFLIQLGGTVVMPVLPLFIADLSSSQNAATASGIVLGATGAVSALSALAIGRMSDRIGPTRILPICMLGAAVSFFPQAFVQQVWQLLLLRMILGIFLGGLMPTANALVASTVPAERRGAAFGLTATSTAMANAVGPMAGAGVTTYWGMRSVFLVTGALFGFGYGWVLLGFRRGLAPLSRPQRNPEARVEAFRQSRQDSPSSTSQAASTDEITEIT